MILICRFLIMHYMFTEICSICIICSPQSNFHGNYLHNDINKGLGTYSSLGDGLAMV